MNIWKILEIFYTDHIMEIDRGSQQPMISHTILFLVLCKPNELKWGTYILPPEIDSNLHRNLKYWIALNLIIWRKKLPPRLEKLIL